MPEARPEGRHLLHDLLVHLEVRHVVDVRDPVGVRHVDAAAAGHQLVRHDAAHSVLVKTEGEAELLHVTLVVLDVGEVLVQLGIAAGHLVQVGVEGGVVVAQHLKEVVI